MRPIRREVFKALRKLAIDSWNKETLDKSKGFLIPYVDDVIEVVLNELREENKNPPKQCCGHVRKKEEINIYTFFTVKRRSKVSVKDEKNDK